MKRSLTVAALVLAIGGRAEAQVMPGPPPFIPNIPAYAYQMPPGAPLSADWYMQQNLILQDTMRLNSDLEHARELERIREEYVRQQAQSKDTIRRLLEPAPYPRR